MTRHRPDRGVSLLEVLMALSIGTVLVAGAAAHFRTLRQVSDLTTSRHESLQNARVAFERLARQIRTAKQVTAISAGSSTTGSITLLDPSGLTHVFALQGTDLLYGNAAATDLLASGIKALTFQGYNKLGTVPSGQPGNITAVGITLTPAVASSARTAGAAVTVTSLSTRVRMGRELGTYPMRSYTTYATLYQTTLGSGLDYPTYAFGAPDAVYATCFNNKGGRYYGFAHGPYYGIVRNLYAGLRILHKSGSLQVIVSYDSTTLLNRTYAASDLDPVHDVWGWWSLDLSSLRAQWLDSDIERLSIEVRDPASTNTNVRFDSLCISACFDSVQSSTFWANSLGSGQCPSEWYYPTRAFGPPDDSFATGDFDDDAWQSYAFDVPDSTDEIATLHLRLEGYLTFPIFASNVEIRTALATQAKDKGVLHVLSAADLANRFYYSNRGTILVDLTNDRAWTWNDLKTFEARIRLRDHDVIDPQFRLDSIAWKVTRRSPVERGISTWSEP